MSASGRPARAPYAAAGPKSSVRQAPPSGRLAARTVHPQAVKTRAVNDAKDFAATELNSARNQFVDEFGNYRWDRIGYLAAAVVGSVAFVGVLKALFRR